MPIANIKYVNNIRAIKRLKFIESIFYFLNNKYFL